MAKMENPGALAGATGAKKSIHATAEDFFSIAHGNRERHNSSAPLEVTPGGKSAERAMVKWRPPSAIAAFGDSGGEDFTRLEVSIETIMGPLSDTFPENQRLHALRLIETAAQEGGAA